MSDILDILGRFSHILEFSQYRFGWVSSGYVGSGIIVAVLAVLVVSEDRAQRSLVRRSFALNMLFIVLFQVAIGLCVAAGTQEQAASNARLGISLIGLISASSLSFGCVIAGQRRALRAVRRVAWVMAIGMFIVSLGSEWFTTGVRGHSHGYFLVAGPLMPLMLGHLCLVMIGAVVVLLRAVRGEVDPLRRRQLRVVSVAYLLGTFTFPDAFAFYAMSWTPIGYVWVTLSAITMSYAIREHKALAAPDFGWRALTWVWVSSLAVVALAGSLWASRDWLGWNNTAALTATVFGLTFCARGYAKYVQPQLDAAFLRRRHDYHEALGRLSDRLLVLHTASAIARQVAEVVRRLMFARLVVMATRNQVGEWRIVYTAGGDVVPPDDHDLILGVLLRSAKMVDLETIDTLDLSEGERNAATELFDRYGAAVLFPVLNPLSDQLLALAAIGPSSDGRSLSLSARKRVASIQDMLSAPLAAARLYDRRRQLGAELERRVKARTAELNTTLRGLKETQDRLVHREKMATLGVVVSGVAGKLAAAVNQVSTEVPALDESLRTYDDVAQRYRRALPDNDKGRELQEWGKTVELDYLRRDIDPLLTALTEGARRASGIAADMSRFAHVPRISRDVIDVHRELDSALNLLHHDFKGRVVVERNYAEGLPRVRCERGPIGQVFMNLLINAAQAMAGTGTLELSTAYVADEDNVEIHVRDSGVGIAQDQIEHVFEPFFTTKAFGRLGGTGLGLSVSYRIIERHGGTITVKSELAKGAEFCVTLPVAAEDPGP